MGSRGNERNGASSSAGPMFFSVFRFIQNAAGSLSSHALTAAITTGINAITASTAKKIDIISIVITPYFPSLAVTGAVFFSMRAV